MPSEQFAVDRHDELRWAYELRDRIGHLNEVVANATKAGVIVEIRDEDGRYRPVSELPIRVSIALFKETADAPA